MENYKFSTLEYKRPDLEAHRTQLAQWKAAVGQAESYEALRSLIFEIDHESCELFTQYSIAHIRHTLDTRDEFYEAEINYLQDTLPTLSGDEVALSEAIAASPFRADIEREFGKQYFVSMDLQKKLFCEANIPLRQQESRLTNEYQKIMATAEISFDGKTLNLYGVQKYFEHPDRTVRAANSYGAAAPAVPVKDTIKTVAEDGAVTGTPDRSTLRAVQTPQVFEADLLKAALQSALENEVPVTDDCSAVERLGKVVYLIDGDEENLKITTPVDLVIAEAILAEREGR